MGKEVPFSKYSGCGNDFILIDNRQKRFSHPTPEFISHLTHRTHGIGADGLIFLENSLTADFRMRIFNCDGSEAEMCGNGIRCLMKFIKEMGFAGDKCTIETMQGAVKVGLQDERVAVSMPNPKEIIQDLSLVVDSKPYLLHCLNTGVPHSVLFVEDLDSSHWMVLAPKIRFHPFFAPRGTNVNFACTNEGEGGGIRIRTYERGVEQETLACGTGATAVGLAAAKRWQLPSPIKIRPQSNTPIEIAFKIHNDSISDVVMTGPAEKIFHGEFVSDLT